MAQLLTNAALVSPRVLRDPAPSAALSAFGADGLEFTVGFWIADPENGSLGLRSDINRAILSALRATRSGNPLPPAGHVHVQVDGAVPAAMSPGEAPRQHRLRRVDPRCRVIPQRVPGSAGDSKL